MGLFDDDEELDALFEEASIYPSCILDLNEGNVEAIFNRCLSNEDTEELITPTLFPSMLGYKKGTNQSIDFDKKRLLENKRSIEYLFGQLQEVHTLQKERRVNLDDYNTTYKGEHWTRDRATLLKFLYLGVTSAPLAISPFRAKDNTSLISPDIKPTLSPKDPAFPAWWEAHKGEWEQ